ncbi:MAG: GAF domain-containing protein [Bacteroidota bacterium]
MGKEKNQSSKGLKRKYARVILAAVVGLFLLAIISAYSVYHVYMKDIQKRELARLEAIVKTLSIQIDGDLHQKLDQQYEKGGITNNDADLEYAQLHRILSQAQKQNNLPTDIYTLVMKEGTKESQLDNSFYFLVSSGNPYFKDAYTPPKQLFWNYQYGGLLEPYTSANGTWISAFAPIKNANGEVVAIVEADLEMTKFNDAAFMESMSSILPFLVTLGILIIIISIVIYYLANSLVRSSNQLLKDSFGKVSATQDVITTFVKSIENEDYTSDIDVGEVDDNAVVNSLVNVRTYLKDSKQEDSIRQWTNHGLAKFAEILRGDQNNLETLSIEIVSSLVKYLNANQGSLYIAELNEENEPVLKLSACYAYDKKKYLEKTIEPGDGLVGQCFLEKETLFMTKVPEDYINITSGLGEATARNILIVPLMLNEEVFGIIEVASFQALEAHEVSFVEKIAENIAATISSVQTNERTRKLLEESKELTENLRSQEEELRQNQEEMMATQEEMGRVMEDYKKQLADQTDQNERLKKILKKNNLDISSEAIA